MLQKILVKLRKSIWLIPTVCSIVGLALSITVVLIDTSYIANIRDILPHYLFTDIDLAIHILSTIAASLLTMITFTFSTMMIVLTMYSSQFSPRVLPSFLTDRKSTTVLGVFMGSFIYSIFSLLFLRQGIGVGERISATVGLGLIILCLSFFTFFIYHVTTSIRVENLVKSLYQEATGMLANYNQNIKEGFFHHVSLWREDQESQSTRVVSTQNGYVQVVDYQGLLEVAIEHRAVIKVLAKAGTFVVKGEELAILYKKNSSFVEENTSSIRGKFTLGNERSPIQDIEFSMGKLVDIALRAISPGINDPNTAKECINAIGMVLGEISKCSGEIITIKDKKGCPRVVMEGIDFKEILYFTFYQLRHYGERDISIVQSNLDALIIAAYASEKKNKEIIWEFRKYVIEIHDSMGFNEMDQFWLDRKIEKLNNVCNKSVT